MTTFRPDGSIDEEYTWGRHPTLYISPRRLAQLVALRGLVQDARRGIASRLYDLDLHQDLTPNPSGGPRLDH